MVEYATIVVLDRYPSRWEIFIDAVESLLSCCAGKWRSAKEPTRPVVSFRTLALRLYEYRIGTKSLIPATVEQDHAVHSTSRAVLQYLVSTR